MHVVAVFNYPFDGAEQLASDSFEYVLETECDRAFIRDGFLTIVGKDEVTDTLTSLNYAVKTVVFFKVKGLERLPDQELYYV